MSKVFDVSDSLVVDAWRFSSPSFCRHIIMPDGCRDIIFSYNHADGLRYQFSPLADRAYPVSTNEYVRLTGFRLAPRVEIDEPSLAACWHRQKHHHLLPDGWWRDFCHLQPSVAEALECLRTELSTSVALVSRQLGVSARTLQRLLQSATGKPPGYWRSLVRARRCAQLLSSPTDLADIAATLGYSDQAHMTRELKKWFGVTPGALRQSPALLQSIHYRGYD